MHVQIAEGIRSILLVEDEGLVSMMVEELLREMGARDVHVHADLEGASATAEKAHLDCAVLDLKVRGGETTPIADILAERGIPFIFATGSDLDSLPERHRDRPLIIKPFSDDDFRLLLLDTWSAGRGQRRVATPSPTN